MINIGVKSMRGRIIGKSWMEVVYMYPLVKNAVMTFSTIHPDTEYSRLM